MRFVAALLALLLSADAFAGEPQFGGMTIQRGGWHHGPLRRGTRPLLTFLQASSTDQGTITTGANFFQAFKQELTGAWWMVLPDGTNPTGSVAVTSSGSPTLENVAVCPNGNDCSTTPQIRLNGTSQFYQSATGLAGPSGDFFGCALVRNSSALGTTVSLISKEVSGSRAMLFSRGSNDLLSIRVYNPAGTGVTYSAGGGTTSNIKRRSRNWLCFTYHWVSDGASVANLYVDGVILGAGATNMRGPATNATGRWELGASNFVGSEGFEPGDVELGFISEKLPTTATLLAMNDFWNPRMFASNGTEVTVTTSLSPIWCLKSDRTAATLASYNRQCVHGGKLHIEKLSTNSLLQSNDLSNASWVKSNMTCTQTALGMDSASTSNSASTCTATADNASVLQVLTLAAATRSTSLAIKRRTGTGIVNLTRDGLSNKIDITAAVGAGWVLLTPEQFPGFTSSILNPSIGIQLGTSGDAVDIEKFQDQTGSFATSPIDTTTVAVATAARYYSITNPIAAADTTWEVKLTASMHGDTWVSGVEHYLWVAGVDAAVNFARGAVDALGRPYFRLRENGGTTNTIISLTPLANDSAEHTFEFRNISGVGTLLVDGVVAATGTLNNWTTVPTGIVLGETTTNGSTINGDISRVCIDNKVGYCP